MLLVFALYVPFCMCFEYVCLGSNVNPNIVMICLWGVLCCLLLIWLSVLDVG